LLPVCSPALLEGAHPLRHPDDLAHHTLLHALDGADDWRLWLRAAGVQRIDPTRGPKFDSIPLVLQAAASGAGVGIGRRQLVTAEVDSGRLVAPFDLELPDECAYYFVAPDAAAEQPKVVAFRNWLRAEVQSSDSEGEAEADAQSGPADPGDGKLSATVGLG
jgi:LysR family glycine cleavage system transcriptional activator